MGKHIRAMAFHAEITVRLCQIKRTFYVSGYLILSFSLHIKWRQKTWTRYIIRTPILWE